MIKINNWNFYEYEELDSTNTQAKLMSQNLGAGAKFVVTSRYQNNGRGRFDRKWQQRDGNLYFSQCFEFPTEKIGQLIFVSSLSLVKTIKDYDISLMVAIKWPNDILVNGAKISGTLLEKGANNYFIIGIGVNILSIAASDDFMYPITSLEDFSIKTTAKDFLHKYIHHFDETYNIWQEQGFEKIKKEWLNYAKGLGEKICVRCIENEKTGIFYGVDENGLLLLKNYDNIEKIFAGDIFYI